MKKLLEQNIFWIILILTIVRFLFQEWYYSTGTWNLNRTVGWGYDIANFTWVLTQFLSCSMIVFTIGYGVLYFAKRETKAIFSGLHLLLITLIIITPLHDLVLSLGLLIFAWLIFFLSLFRSRKI